MIKEIKIEDWNKKKFLSKIKFSFSKLYKKSVTYFSENSKYVIYVELDDRPELLAEMTANDLYQESISFKIEQLY
jgi:hypothetical protein